jgi:diaminohydroxyphosphoribosylaminopyrimidine deaminase/5-amino-6-(5-phosphoribosylamino)uracil reductase
VHRLRDWNDAVLVGIGTARADDPQLTARGRGQRNPVRVVVDARAELALDSYLAQTAREAPVIVAAGADADAAELEAVGVIVERVPLADGRIDLDAFLRQLVQRGIHSVLCEGGGGVAGALMDAGLVDEVVWFIAPKLVGGREAPGPLAGVGVQLMADARQLERVRLRKFGDDLAVFGYVHRDH